MTILVVNPNSSPAVTKAIAEALYPLGPHFEVTHLANGPETIRTDEDVRLAGMNFADLAASRPEMAGFVTACFSDPGLDLARSLVSKPVTGAQEAAILEAAADGRRFGVIALSERAVPRHLRRIKQMGLLPQLVGELPLQDVSAAASGNDPEVYAQIQVLGRQLADAGAGALVLGCAGMARLAQQLEGKLGLPVIDPVAAAGRLALARAN